MRAPASHARGQWFKSITAHWIGNYERTSKRGGRLLPKGFGGAGEGKRDSDPLKVRDAAEKAWNAVVQATNALLAKRNFPLPQSHIERRRTLGELERQDPEVRELGLRDRFMARAQSLHEECFYEGYCPVEILERDLEKVKEYIEDIKRL